MPNTRSGAKPEKKYMTITPEHSDLEKFMEMLERAFPLRINFDDLSGITLDIERLRLPQKHRDHTCPFCMFSKMTNEGFSDCVRNRNAVARILQKKPAAMQGSCHMGLFELIHPLVYHGHYLGKFHYGQVILKGTTRNSKRRLRTYCDRHKLDSTPFLEAFNTIPIIDPEDIPFYQQTLKLLVDFVATILINHGLPAERYRTHQKYVDAKQHKELPLAIRRVLEHIGAHHTESLTLQATAKELGYRPEYLCRIFKQKMDIGFHDYLQNVRMDHARHLLKHSTQKIAEIGFIVGFEDASHFNRIFKRMEGITPGRYREERNREVEKSD